MSVYAKLQKARIKLQGTKLTKSGKNKFAGYEYFELSDFLPAIQEICNEVGLCGVVTFQPTMAYLTIFDTETEGAIVFSSPMSTAALKGCHEVQNLGAVQTYLRRYLWTSAFEIVEHDALDATISNDPPKPAPKPVAKEEPKEEPKKEAPPARIVGAGEWKIDAPPLEGTDPEEWKTLVTQAATLQLGLAKTSDDVMAIYRNNRVLFDTAKAHDEAFFKGLMESFTNRKNAFKESK